MCDGRSRQTAEVWNLYIYKKRNLGLVKNFFVCVVFFRGSICFVVCVDVCRTRITGLKSESQM